MKRMLLIGLLGGCSFALSRPPDPPRPGALPCAVSRAPAVIDTWQAVGSGVLTLWALGYAADDDHSDGDTIGAIGALSGVMTALWGGSALYGFRNARACDEQRVGYVMIPVLVEEEIEEHETEIHRTRTIRRRPIGP